MDKLMLTALYSLASWQGMLPMIGGAGLSGKALLG